MLQGPEQRAEQPRTPDEGPLIPPPTERGSGRWDWKWAIRGGLGVFSVGVITIAITGLQGSLLVFSIGGGFDLEPVKFMTLAGGAMGGAMGFWAGGTLGGRI